MNPVAVPGCSGDSGCHPGRRVGMRSVCRHATQSGGYGTQNGEAGMQWPRNLQSITCIS